MYNESLENGLAISFPLASEHFIICIDDDRDFIKSLEFFLPDKINQKNNTDLWYQFLFFDTPSIALNTLKEIIKDEKEVAMVISDQMMPDMKGIELLSKVKNISPQSIRVLLTGYAGVDSAIKAINENLLDKYLTKPINNENDFILNIQYLIQRYHMQKTISIQNKIIRELYQFSDVLNSLEDFQQTLDYIVSFIGNVLECQSIYVMLYENSSLRIKASKGIPDNVANSISIKCGKKLSEEVFQLKKPILIKKPNEIPYLNGMIDVDTRAFTKMPLLLIGLSCLEQPLGVINVAQKMNDLPFHYIDIETLTYIANTASIAIHNHINRIKLQKAYFETKAQATRLEYQVMHDNLTGFPSKMMLMSKMHEAIQAKQDEKRTFALLLINLDNLKKISNKLNNQYKNIVLQKIGRKFQKIIQGSHILACLEDSKFAVLIHGATIKSAAQCSQRMLDSMKNPIEFEDLSFEINISIGISFYPDHGEDINLLFHRAETALNITKTSGDKYRIYNSNYDKRNRVCLTMMSELHKAIKDNQLALYYQPKINFRSNLVTGVEALIRWNYPKYGFMPFDRFIQLVEQAGISDCITYWLLDEALCQCNIWQKEGLKICVAVSLTAQNLQDESLPDHISELLEKWKVEPGFLELDIAEVTVIPNIESAKMILKRLTDMGIRLSIDDFGTGYSSQDYIKQFPIIEIKIDNSFIMRMGKNDNDFMIVNVAIDISQDYESSVSEGGIKGEEIYDHLIKHGCSFIEGYFMHRRISYKKFLDWIDE